jgi:hypothetical protein
MTGNPATIAELLQALAKMQRPVTVPDCDDPDEFVFVDDEESQTFMRVPAEWICDPAVRNALWKERQ